MGFGAGFHRFSLILSLCSGGVAWGAGCPGTIPNYETSGSVCRPVLPNNEFAYETTYNEFPVCGTNRIPVSGDGSYRVMNCASYGPPNSSATFTVGPYTFKNTTSSSNGPIYGYEIGSRCACFGTVTHTRPNPATTYAGCSALPPMLSATTPRMYPDTADVISSQDYTNSARYGPVAISTASTGGMNGRLYAKLFPTASATSFCGCPNFNEIAAAIASSSDPVGAVCSPGVNASDYRVLTPYNPEYHFTVLPQILDSLSAEPTVSPTPNPAHGAYVTEFQLPVNTSDFTNMVTYRRRIWTCAAPYELNVATGDCEYTAAHHACDDGSGGGPVSAYPLPSPTSTPQASEFNGLINRKLACCLNREDNSNPLSPYAKFDCISNAIPTSFDALWSSSDTEDQGEQLNAMVLMSGAGIPVSGFYTVDGARCAEFSEFAFSADIQPYRLNPPRIEGQQAVVSGTPNPIGTPIPIPTSTQFAALSAAAIAAGKRAPATANEYLRCPILVRSAMVATCPVPTVVPNAISAIVDPDDGSTRCPVASSIQIHVRIQQIYEITGRPVLPVLDTVMNPGSNQAIDVSNIISAKYGDGCPPGTSNNHGICTY